MSVLNVFGIDDHPNNANVEMKICKICGVEKPFSSFPKHRGHKDRIDTRCRDCMKEGGKYRDDLRKISPPPPTICECCHKEAVDTLRIDHNHDVEDVHISAFRGWLCDDCNVGIGNLGDTLESVQKALTYLEHYYNRMELPESEMREQIWEFRRTYEHLCPPKAKLPV